MSDPRYPIGRFRPPTAMTPELRAELGIVHDRILTAALIAVAVGVATGLLVAFLIASRLRRKRRHFSSSRRRGA